MKKSILFICLLFASWNLFGESGCMSFYRGTKLGKNPLQEVKQTCHCNCQQRMRDLPTQRGNRCVFCKHFRKPSEIQIKKSKS